MKPGPRFKIEAALFVFLLVLPWHGYGNQATQPTNQATKPAFSNEEIEQLVAPIALYTDKLLAQILMASTYPLEIVSAARWVQKNPQLKDKALEDALRKETWDPSVKSLALVPQVLNMLNEKLEMTQKLGDAFLAQQKDVLDAVQRLRQKAQVAGNLKSSKEQSVSAKPEGAHSVIVIEPADPNIVYVPTYDPNTIYGTWPYPSYPPYYYYSEDYVPHAGLYFGAGLALGHRLWGNLNWNDGSVNIDIDRFNNFNGSNIRDNTWRHHVDHRKGVQYRDQATQRKFGRDQSQGVRDREAFRGRVDSGRRDSAQQQPRAASRDQQRMGQGRDSRAQERSFSNRQPQRSVQQGNFGGQRQGAFDGINRGAETRRNSNRGRSSRPSGYGGGGRGGYGGYGGRGGGGGRGGRGGGGRGGRGGGGRRR